MQETADESRGDVEESDASANGIHEITEGQHNQS
jgi:hypothetical protein